MKKQFLLALFVLCIAKSSFAGQDGNGGDGLYLKGKLYSLDLVEAGVETKPVFNTALTAKKEVLERLGKKLDPQIVPVQLIGLKLREIAQVDELFVLSILKTIETYNWRLVDSSLIDIKDEESVLNYDPASLVQLAIRKSTSVLIDRNLYSQLDPANKAALIFHEALYAMVKPQYLKDPNTGDFYRDNWGRYTYVKAQSSTRAREMTGYLFTRDLSVLGYKGLKNVAQSDYALAGGASVQELSGSMTFAFFELYFDMNSDAWRNSNYGVALGDSHDAIFKNAQDACKAAKSSGLDVTLLRIDQLYSSRLTDYQSVTAKKSAYIVEDVKMMETESQIKATNIEACAKEATSQFENMVSYLKREYGRMK